LGCDRALAWRKTISRMPNPAPGTAPATFASQFSSAPTAGDVTDAPGYAKRAQRAEPASRVLCGRQ
jgi:hypothetical protein